MSSVLNVSCRVHHVEYIVGSTINLNGESPRRHLVCPVEGCTAAEGKFCSQCRDLVRTERRPEHDRETHNGKAIFAAYLCPICGYNMFEVECKPAVEHVL
jgi:hypothetical protein